MPTGPITGVKRAPGSPDEPQASPRRKMGPAKDILWNEKEEALGSYFAFYEKDEEDWHEKVLLVTHKASETGLHEEFLVEDLKAKPGNRSRDGVGDDDDYLDGWENRILMAQKKSTRKAKRGGGEVNLKHLNETDLKKFKAARKKEIDKIILEKKALRVINPSEAKKVWEKWAKRVLRGRYVDIWKEEDVEEPEAKSRYVLPGHLDPDILDLIYNKKLAASTVSAEGKRLTLQVIASLRAELELADVAGAFMEADDLDRDGGPLFLLPPPEAGLPEGSLLEIVKPLYGLNDAPQRWRQKYDKVMKECGAEPSRLDPCVYLVYEYLPGTEAKPRTESGLMKFAEERGRGDVKDCLKEAAPKAKKRKLVGIASVHVDDSAWGGIGSRWKEFRKKLASSLPFRKIRRGEGDFCGSHLRQLSDGTIEESQSKFTTVPPCTKVPSAARASSPLNFVSTPRAPVPFGMVI